MGAGDRPDLAGAPRPPLTKQRPALSIVIVLARLSARIPSPSKVASWVWGLNRAAPVRRILVRRIVARRILVHRIEVHLATQVASQREANNEGSKAVANVKDDVLPHVWFVRRYPLLSVTKPFQTQP